MSVLTGPVKFDSGTGSDTQASGCGPATAIFGTAASFSGTPSTVTGLGDTSTVTVGDLLFLLTTTGRMFSRITAKAAGQVTVEDTFGGTSTGRTWAIGGKRATLEDANSRTLFGSVGAKAGWVIETESDQTLNTALVFGAAGSLADGFIVLRGMAGAKRIINQTTNTDCITCQNIWHSYENLKFTNSGGTKTLSRGIKGNLGTAYNTHVHDCIFGDPTNKLTNGIAQGSGTFKVIVSDSLFQDCIGAAIRPGGALQVYNSKFVGNALGIDPITSTPDMAIVGCLFWDNAGTAIKTSAIVADTQMRLIADNIFWDNAGSGLDLSVGEFHHFIIIRNNIFGLNTNYGVLGVSSPLGFAQPNFADGNAFYSNTSGEYRNIAGGPNDITLSADPFIDSANGDFRLNEDAGGGALLRPATGTIGEP